MRRHLQIAFEGVARRGAAPRLLVPAAGLLTMMLTGCTDWSYRQIQIGQDQRTVDRVLPAGGSRRTDLGLCYLGRDSFGRTDALLILLTRDRQVFGKIHATHFRRNYGFKTEVGYRLRGELDPRLAGLSATGPIDTLRAISDDLIGYQGEKVAMDAHAWVASGLIRLMQRWPHVSDVGLRTEDVAETLELVPSGGTARISVNEAGIYEFEYRQGTIR